MQTKKNFIMKNFTFLIISFFSLYVPIMSEF